MGQVNFKMVFDGTDVAGKTTGVAVTATRDSTNTLKVGNRRGQGNRVNVEVQITEAFNNLTTLLVEVYQSADDTTYDALPIASSGAIPLASLTIGAKVLQYVLPPNHKAYLKTKYTVVGTAPTLGKVLAHLVNGPEHVL